MKATRIKTDHFLITDHELSDLILEHTEAALVLCDVDSRIVLANPAAQKIFRGDPVGALFAEAFRLTRTVHDPSGNKTTETLTLDTVLKGEIVQGMYTLARDSEAVQYILVKASPYHGPHDEILCCIVSLTDVTAPEIAQRRMSSQAALLDLSPNAMILRALNGEITFWSQGAAKLYGYDAAQAVGKLVHQLLQTGFPESLEAQYTALVNEGYWEGELTQRTSDGRTLIVYSRQVVQRDKGNTPIAVLKVDEDISERKRVEQALGDSLKRYAALVRASTQIVWTTPPDGQVVEMSEWRALTGQTLAQVHGRGWLAAIHPDDRARTADIWQTSIDTRTVCETEFRVRLVDGAYRWYALRVVPVMDPRGSVTEWIGALTDIQEQKRTEEAQEFLARATNVFGASLDFETTLRNIAQLAIPFLADWCSVHILEEGGMVRRLTVVHPDPVVNARANQRPHEFPLDQDIQFLVSHVLRTGEGEIYNDVTDELLRQAARDQGHLDILRELGIKAYMCLPLRARGRTLGAVTFAISNSGRRYGTREADLARELVQRAGLAVDNAWLFQESQAAQTRLKLLAEASSELISSVDFDERMERLTHVVVPRFADWCTVNLLEANGRVRLAALAHVNPDREAIVREWADRHPLSSDALFGTPNVIRTGKAEWVPDVARRQAEWDRQDPVSAETRSVYMQRLRMESYMIIPLIARGRTLGAITFVSGESGRRYNFQDLLIGEEIARRAAVAMDNAALFQQEQQARREAEENAARVAALQRVAAALAGVLTVSEVSHVVLEQGARALGAQGGVLAQLIKDGSTVQVLSSFGYRPELIAQWQEFPANLQAPISDAVRKGELLVYESPEAFYAQYPDALQAASGYGAWMVMPLKIEGRALGGLHMGFAAERTFTEADRAFATVLAQQAAQALERARLFESELVARQAAERAAHRSEWLTEASHLLASSLEYEQTLKDLAQLAVPELADWCQIHVAKGDGTAEQLALTHKDSAQLKWAEEYIEEIRQHFTPRWDSPIGLPNVLRTGKSEIYYDVPDSMLEQVSENEVQLNILRGIGYSSVMIVPLNIQDKTLGAITLVNTESRRHFTDDDLAFAELLAGRAAVAIENARLYRETQELNAELERRVQHRTAQLHEAYTTISQEVVERSRAEERTFALLRISSKLNSTLDLDSTFDILVQETQGMLNATSGLAGLRTEQGMQLHRYYEGAERIPYEFTWKPGEGMPGWVLKQRAPYMTNDARSDSLILDTLAINQNVKTAICVPIFDAESQVLGFISVREKKDGEPFTVSDMEFMTALSPLAAIAVENARAYRKIRDAEAAVKDSYAQLRALAARLHTIREEERTDMARELHDELGQALTALKMDLSALTAHLPKRNAALRERAQAISAQIDETIKTVRRMSTQMRPGMLDDLGLGPSMEWYAQEFQTRTGITSQVRLPPEELDLSTAQATALFRIFQETLTNVARHASATAIQVDLTRDENFVTLRVTDDGAGFDVNEVRGKRSLGLLGMRERAQMVQGTLEIDSKPGAGTAITVNVPLNPPAET